MSLSLIDSLPISTAASLLETHSAMSTASIKEVVERSLEERNRACNAFREGNELLSAQILQRERQLQIQDELNERELTLYKARFEEATATLIPSAPWAGIVNACELLKTRSSALSSSMASFGAQNRSFLDKVTHSHRRDLDPLCQQLLSLQSELFRKAKEIESNHLYHLHQAAYGLLENNRDERYYVAGQRMNGFEFLQMQYRHIVEGDLRRAQELRRPAADIQRLQEELRTVNTIWRGIIWRSQ